MIKNTSLADQVYEQLERGIILGEYEQGSTVTEKDIADKLGVSRTPVREALNRLEHDNMVEETGKGTKIIGISEKDIITIYRLREMLDGLCAVEAAENITDDEIRQLSDILDYSEFCVMKQDPDKIRECDNNFHDILYRSSRNPVLYNILIPLHKKAAKYRWLTISDPSRAQLSAQEHRQILEALKKHDKEMTKIAMVSHASRARQAMEKAQRNKRMEENG
ncbi:MAG: GntR family transcriptional regulator [Lachnospiraceae bacterium]|nr:GntR family transcriptional regulator [Candidatus Darwinimomas equi]